MPDKKTALALALEAEHEAEQVADTYQALATVLGVDEELSDAQQASDIATGLEELHFVLESLKEQDVHDIALTQVIGDLCGAATNTSGELFTPSMEDMEAENDSADRAATLTDRVKEILAKLLEKLKALIQWIPAKFRDLVISMKAGLTKLRQMGEKKINKLVAQRVKRMTTRMNDTTKAMEDFIPLIAAVAQVRIAAGQEPAGFSEEGLDISILNEMDRCVRDMESFSKKFDNDRYVGTIGFGINIDRVDHQSAQAAVLTFSQCYFEIKRTSASSDALDEAYEGEAAGSVDAMINEIEAVSTSYARFLGEHGALSLPALIKGVEKKIVDFESKTKDTYRRARARAMGETEAVGPTQLKVINMTVMGMTRDVAALTKLSSYATIDAANINSLLKTVVNVDEPEAVPA